MSINDFVGNIRFDILGVVGGAFIGVGAQILTEYVIPFPRYPLWFFIVFSFIGVFCVYRSALFEDKRK